MVQVLPYVPAFGEKLAETLAQAGSNVAQGLIKKRALNRFQSLFSPVATDAYLGQNQPASQYEMALNQVTPQQTVAYGQSPINNLLNKPGGPNLSDVASIYNLAESAYPGFGKTASEFLLNQQKVSQKEASEIRKEERQASAQQQQEFKDKLAHQGNIQKTFNVASSLLAKNIPGIGVSPGAKTGLSRKAVEGRNTFNTLKGKFESILLPMVNKGTLAKERFNFILSQIPDASDSQRAIAGKLRGLAETLSEEGFPIDTRILDSIPWVSQELKGLGQEGQERPPLESFFK